MRNQRKTTLRELCSSFVMQGERAVMLEKTRNRRSGAPSIIHVKTYVSARGPAAAKA